MRKQKIVIVQPVLSPYLSNRLKELAKEKSLDIILLLERTSLRHRPGWDVQKINGIQIFSLESSVFRHSSQNIDFGYVVEGIRSIPWRLPFKLLKIRPDIVVFCNATQILLALAVKRLIGCKFFLVVEDTLHATRNSRKLNRAIKNWAYRRCDRWFPFSEDATEFLYSIGVSTGVRRSSWSIDMQHFKPNKNNLKNSGNTLANKKKILFVGRLMLSKGVLTLLHELKRLPDEIRGNIELYLIGSGPLQEQLAEYVRKNNLEEVHLLGQLSYNEVCRHYQEADLFVLPTLQDLFSLTVLEAMACGCPVITTPFNGARELVDDGETGWIVDPTISGNLSKALLNALQDKSKLDDMGRKARKRVEKMDNAVVMADFANELKER